MAAAAARLMGSAKRGLQLQGTLWLEVGGENLAGPGRIELLARIAECGSISAAARAIGMSYKAAWDAIDSMNNLAGRPLVERLTGGRGGGGTRLTRRGEQLVRNFRLIESEHRRFVEQLGRQSEGIADDYLLLRRMSLQTSARNTFQGTVVGLTRGAVNDEVELEVVGGHRLVASVTHVSCESLGLRIGGEAFALVKASSIILLSDGDDVRLSARNRLAGRIARLSAGAVNTEVVLELPNGGAIAAIVTHAGAKSLGLVEGGAATAIFKASSVIIGVPA